MSELRDVLIDTAVVFVGALAALLIAHHFGVPA